MPRYFFHVHNHIDALDEEGQELPSLDLARATAIQAARDLACESILGGDLNLDHRIDIANEEGDVLQAVTFQDAFNVSGGRRNA